MSKVSTLTHFPLEQGYEDYSFLDQVVEDLHNLDSILTYFIKTPEMDASFNEAKSVSSSVSSEFLQLVSTISDISKLQLASSIKSLKLFY